MTKFIDIDNVIIIEKNVTEEIEKKNLKYFIHTILNEQNHFFDRKTHIFYSFIPSSLKYIIYLTNNKYSKYNSLLPHIFTVMYFLKKLDKNKIDLFTTKNFFALYLYGDMVYYRKIEENTHQKDIKNYIEKIFNIIFDNEYNYDEHAVNDIKINYMHNYNKISKIASLNDKNETKIILIYLLLFLNILVGLGIIYVNQYSNYTSNKKAIKIHAKNDLVVKLPVIRAVLLNSILINNVWYNKNDTYKSFLIQDINSNYVVLKKYNKIFNIKISND